jgi:hypothetical protein
MRIRPDWLTFGLVVLLGSLPLVGWSTEVTSYRFAVSYDGRSIGEHRFDVVRQGNVVRASSEARFRVRLLLVPVYRYHHVAHEQWQGRCLTSLRSVTDDNGRSYEVNAEHSAGTLQLVRRAPDGGRQQAAEPCPASFAYWDLEKLSAPRLLNAQTGELSAARLTAEGEDRLDGEPALRYRLEAEGLAPILLWYHRDHGHWLGLETRRDGGVLRYRLVELESGYSAREHAGV